MRFQYISDIHLEIWPAADPKNPKCAEFYKTILKPDAHYLILAGDICSKTCSDRLEPFLEYCSANWLRVFYVAGNHEYYTIAMTMDTVNEWLSNLCSKFPNINYLQCSEFHLDEKHVIIGCTLWSEIDSKIPWSTLKSMNDFRRILVAPGVHLTPDTYNEIHYEHKKWLLATVKKRLAEDKVVIVITHHVPTSLLIAPKYASDPLNCCFSSEVARELKMGPHAWFYGHTHMSGIQHFNGTMFYINALGYPGEKKTAPIMAISENH
jgi:predicted phosphodiesterase